VVSGRVTRNYRDLIVGGNTMEDTGSPTKAKPMTLKKLDDAASKDFWEYVEKSKQEWLEQQPSWSRELERRETREESPASVARPADPILLNRSCN